MEMLAPAKINLCLNITGRRDNGYHELDSIVAFTDLVDVVNLLPSDDNNITLQMAGPCSHAVDCDVSSNNAVVAAQKLCQYVGQSFRGVVIRLVKHIPVGAGLGGGSADAAAVLKGLNQLWQLELDPQILEKIARGIGADVPVCLYSQPTHMRGIGEKIVPITISENLFLVLVHPNKPLGAAEVYAQFSGPFSNPLAQELFGHDMMNWLHDTKNDLQAAAIELMPEVSQIIAVLSQQEGCVISRMTGSGSACFGLFYSKEQAKLAYQRIKEQQPQWWATSAVIKKS